MVTITNKAMVQNSKLGLYRGNSAQPLSAITDGSNVFTTLLSLSVSFQHYSILIFHSSTTEVMQSLKMAVALKKTDNLVPFS